MVLTEAQREARQGRVGASEAAALPLINEHPFMDAAELYDRVVLGAEREVNQRMLVGQYLEPAILDLLRRIYHLHPLACARAYVHPVLPASCSPDAYLPPDGLVEVKVTSAWAADRPRYVEWQVQQQLWLTRRAYAQVAVLTGSQLQLHLVERDDDMIGQLTEALEQFQADHLVPRIRPAAKPLIFQAKRS